MTIVFFGSDDFALVNLETLARTKHRILACVTQPDRPKGRGMKFQAPVIKEFALRERIPLLQPESLHDEPFLKQLKNFESDLLVVVAYGKILPAEVLAMPKIFCVNVHASLLPKYRGAAPIQWAILNGDPTSGVSIIKMNEFMDAGDIIRQQEIPIDEKDTAVTLRAKLAQTGAGLLLEAIHSIENKTFQLQKQDLSKVTSAPKLTKDLGIIRWEEKAHTIHNLVRGLVPWPGAFTFFKGKRLKILETRIKNDKRPSGTASGSIIEIDEEGITVAASDQPILITKVHYEAGKPMDARSFAVGYRLQTGFKF